MKKRYVSLVYSAKCAIAAVVALLASVPFTGASGAEETLKEMAIARFEAAEYPAAIAYLLQALEESPGDAELHYYLGYYLHYLCYDSVPLTGFGRDKSDEVLQHLEKAVELDPRLGNAYYFIGAEHGARARDEMRLGGAGAVVEEFRAGRRKGGYPDWMIEFGRNLLRSCDQNAILFTGGDSDTNPVEYLQCVEGYRTDVTVIPLALLDWPRFVALLKHGAPGFTAPAPISWSDRQIESMHPYKWKKNTIRVPVPEDIRKAYGIEQTAVEWELSPNLSHGDTPGLLSAGRAVLADIVITNQWRRPIYFSSGCPPKAWEGLESNIQLCGIANRLLPFAPAAGVDAEATGRLLLDENNFKALPGLRDTDMPRVSGMLQNYRVFFITLARQHLQQGETGPARAVFEAMNKFIPDEILPMPEQYKSYIEELERELDKRE